MRDSMGLREVLVLAAVAAVVVAAGAGAVEAEAGAEGPGRALEGLATECLLGLSFGCLQERALRFLAALGSPRSYPLLGTTLLLVRTAEFSPPSPGSAPHGDHRAMSALLDTAVDHFFDTHSLRLSLPSWAASTPRTLDFSLALPGDAAPGSRKGTKGGGGKKGMKKMMMMMMMMMAGKAMMVLPLMMGLIKLAALKALIMGFISLTISKILILKKLKMKLGSGGGGHGGGGHGGGWSSGGGGGGGWSPSGGGGGGGGWDRSLSGHDFAYSSYKPE